MLVSIHVVRPVEELPVLAFGLSLVDTRVLWHGDGRLVIVAGLTATCYGCRAWVSSVVQPR